MTSSSDIASALMEWGNIHLRTPEFEKALADISEGYRACEKEERMRLLSYLPKIEKEVKTAITVLSNQKLITSREGDETQMKTIEALDALDGWTYFQEGVVGVVKPIDPELAEEVLQLLKPLGDKVMNWLFDTSWSPLRLAVLNHYRWQMREYIPRKNRYMFPWYYLFWDCCDVITLMKCSKPRGDLWSVARKFFGSSSSPAEVIYELMRDKELVYTIIDVLGVDVLVPYWRQGDFMFCEPRRKSGLGHMPT